MKWQGLAAPWMVVLFTACEDKGAPRSAEDAYLDNPSARRLSLERSLVNPSNGYSQLRLARYSSGTSQDWD